ncbi:MAG: histidine--tRNA ligase [Actinomycetota bacterium]
MAGDTISFRALKGTHDLLPPESWRWQRAVRLAMDSFALAGYAPVETPMLELTEVFERGVGASSEVVGKQMYTFTDRGGRSLTLRPEGTAPVMRAVLEHGLHRGPLPIKLAYGGAMFRQERPQKGRYRQFFQVGIESIGSNDAAVDAEVIEVGKRYLADAGVETVLVLNSIGHVDPSCRQGYLKVLVEFLSERAAALAPEDRARIATNPLRTFDSKEPRTIETMQEAPLISDHLCAGCAEHFEAVRTHLDDLGIEYRFEPRLVRGLDYYTRTAFEYISVGLGAQNAVGGGGRYDGLSEVLGGPPLAAIGFALGIDRILIAEEEGPGSGAPRARVDVYIVSLGEAAGREALRLATLLRRRGVAADFGLGGRGMKGQMKDADRSGARRALILGEAEIEARTATVKDLATGEQHSVAFVDIETSWTP